MKSPKSPLSCYLPSGRIGARGFLVVSGAGLLSALLVGGLYLWARSEIGSFVATVLCDLFFMVVLAIVAYGLFRSARSRSRGFNRVTAGAWVVVVLLPWWWVAVSGRLAGIDAPSALQHYAALVPTLILLALEAFALGLAPVFLAGETAMEPFSETTGQWAEQDFSLEAAWPGGDAEELLQYLHTQGAVALLELELAAGKTAGTIASSWRTLKIEGRSVEPDPSARWINLYAVDSQRTDDGRIKSTNIPLASSWPISAFDYESLRARAAAPAEISSTTPADATGVEARATQPPAEGAPTPVELEAAVAALEAGNHTTALAMAHPHCQHPDAGVRKDAIRLSALCLSRLERWQEAFEQYHVLFQDEPNPFNALQLASTSVMAGELLRGQAWFEKADGMNKADHAMPPVEMRTGFLSALQQAGEHEACLPHLQWMARMYQAVQTTDAHLLWMNRIPPFGEFLEKSHTILGEIMPPTQCADWYRQNASGLPPEWQAMLDEHLERLA